MNNCYILWLVIVLSCKQKCDGALPAPLLTLLQMGWDQANPYSMNNQVKNLAREIQNIKTHLQKLEHAVMFGKEMKTIEYLIERYNKVYDLNDTSQDKIRWADSALQIGSDGFEKPLAYLRQMMDGSSQIFAEGSIFNVIAKDETRQETICTDLEEASDYLISLWTVGHALWVQAYRIKSIRFEEKAKKLKGEAQSKIPVFEATRDKAYPAHCDCFSKGMSYTDLDYMLGKKSPSHTHSARACQVKCHADDECKVFTFIQSITKCFVFTNEFQQDGKK